MGFARPIMTHTECPPLRPPSAFRPLSRLGGSFQVLVFRGSEASGYPFLPQPHPVAMIAAAAYNKPKLEGGGTRLSPKDASKTKRKIAALLAIGLAHGHDAIVLSAFGCGAFANPPEHLAEIFRECLQDEDEGVGGSGSGRGAADWNGRFGSRYKKVVFAIIDDQNALRNAAARLDDQVRARQRPPTNQPTNQRCATPPTLAGATAWGDPLWGGQVCGSLPPCLPWSAKCSATVDPFNPAAPYFPLGCREPPAVPAGICCGCGCQGCPSEPGPQGWGCHRGRSRRRRRLRRQRVPRPSPVAGGCRFSGSDDEQEEWEVGSWPAHVPADGRRQRRRHRGARNIPSHEPC